MTYKDRLTINVLGYHPLLPLIFNHLKELGVVLKHNGIDDIDCDIVLLGSNWCSYTHKKPTLVLSSSDLYKGTNCGSRIDEGMPYSLHPLADFTSDVLGYVQSETVAMRDLKEVMVVRTFPVYGLGTPDNILNRLIASARNADALIDPNYGWRVRSWLHVTDFFSGFDALLKEFLRGTTGIFNLGNDQGISIRELHKTVWQLAGFDHTNMVEEDLLDLPWRPDTLLPDLTRTKAVTKWKPRVSLRSGITEMLSL